MTTTWSRVELLKTQLPKEHQGISHYVEHALQSIDQFVEQHRQFVAAQALYGERISGEEERLFRETISNIKNELVSTLEKTVEDFKHKGDKHWVNNYKDGVE
ncbi:hypothetical protein Q5741_02650 [Paenibacillus sp. JX-17]|uniref:Uncharacterized protein n=1 Tax=Paenibacillus lacisoli TaxID=3064525 RepID=A0ABT9C7S8_9BACL|nr:hypothetical protein [Paenibacillus sp. JX-17]MDO7905312.1 hypothetical protein [Paenibacillus sp. JX-17]